MSVNEVWQGRRYKTEGYKFYERNVLLKLSSMDIPDGNLALSLKFGLSNINADWDNPIKPFVDILQKKYQFNDRRIYKAIVEKVKVKKGEEYIEFSIQKAQG